MLRYDYSVITQQPVAWLDIGKSALRSLFALRATPDRYDYFVMTQRPIKSSKEMVGTGPFQIGYVLLLVRAMEYLTRGRGG